MIKTGNPIISIYTEMTPNPETMKFVANKLLYPGKSIDFPDIETAKPSPLALELFGFPFIKSVFVASNFVTLTKTPETDWNDLAESLKSAAHPERLAILHLMCTCGCDQLMVKSIYGTLHLQQSSTSRHLGIMKKSGLLKFEIIDK